MLAWEAKAHKLIQELCGVEYRAANYLKNGNRRKKHKPYRVPPLAQELLDCVKYDKEEECKYLFLTRW